MDERVKGGPGRRKGSGKRAGSDAAWGLRAVQSLADPSRYRIVVELASGPRSLGELARRVDLSAPCVSHHVSILNEIGFVDTAREGRRLICALAQGKGRAARLLEIILSDLYLPKISNSHSMVAAPELEAPRKTSKPIEEFLF